MRSTIICSDLELLFQKSQKKLFSNGSKVKSSASWTNEEFGKIYEPVSATELRRQHQVRH